MMFEPSPLNLILAQEGPPAPTDGIPTTAAPGGGTNPPAGSTPSSGPGPSMMMILMLVFVAVIVFSMLGQRRDKKKRDTLLNSIRKHDRVQTIGGVLGSVVEVKPDTVVLKVDESSNTRITFSRASIQQVLSPKESPEQVEEL